MQCLPIKKHYTSACLPSSVGGTGGARTYVVLCELDGLHGTPGAGEVLAAAAAVVFGQ